MCAEARKCRATSPIGRGKPSDFFFGMRSSRKTACSSTSAFMDDASHSSSCRGTRSKPGERRAAVQRDQCRKQKSGEAFVDRIAVRVGGHELSFRKVTPVSASLSGRNTMTQRKASTGRSPRSTYSGKSGRRLRPICSKTSSRRRLRPDHQNELGRPLGAVASSMSSSHCSIASGHQGAR